MPSLILRARGLASGKELGVWEVSDPQENLMDFLRARGIPIASSCGGDGVCQKCVINTDLLSCQFTVEQFLTRYPEAVVTVSYL